MDIQQKNSMYTLLYAMVLIDNHVARVEMKQFFNRIQEFLTKLSFRDEMSAQSEITTWFMQNYKTVMKNIQSPAKETYILEQVKNLRFCEHRQAIFDMMKDIAFADNEYHDAEQALLEKVAQIWGIDSFIREGRFSDTS